MRRLSLLLLAVGLALWAEHTARGPEGSLLDAAILYAVAAGLFVFASRPPERWPALGPRRPWRAAAAFTWSVGVIAGGLAYVGFWRRGDDYTGWPLVFWLAGVALCLLGAWMDDRGRPLPNPAPGGEGRRAPLDRRTELVLLALVVLAGLFLRTWQLDRIPYGCQSDECNNALDALRWLQGEPYRPFVGTNEGQPTLFTYAIAGLFALLGPTVLTLRLAPALAGTLTLLAFYGLARWRFNSPRLALLLTLLLAGSRWHLTFSRIVYELILVPLVLSCLLWALLRALRHGRRLDWVLAGFLVALGLNTYTAFRVVPIWLGLFALYWLLGDLVHPERRPQLQRDAEGWFLAAVTCAVALAPLAVYALRHWDQFTARMRHISVFNDVAAAGSYEPLRQNLVKALLMFNVRGDPAALNNLPAAALLDGVTAALFVLGLAYAVRYVNRPLPFLYVSGMVGQLSLVVLTAAAEAPSARRPIGAIVLIYLLVGEALAQVWDAFDAAWRRVGQRAWQAALAFLALGVALYNAYLYFGVQARRLDVQLAYSPHESAVGWYVRSLPPATRVLVTRAYAHHAAVRFIGGREVETLDLAAHIPLREPPAQEVVYVLDPPLAPVASFLQRLYPTSTVAAHRGPGDVLLFFSVRVSREAVQQAQGLWVAYFPATEPQPRPAAEERVAALDLQFGQPPVGPPFAVRVEGAVLFPSTGEYRFVVDTVGEADLFLDGRKVARAVDGAATVTYRAAAGLVPLRVEYVGRGPGHLRLLWAREGEPVRVLAAPDVYAARLEPRGLIAHYYQNDRWEGAPVAVRREFFVAAANLLREPFSIRWRGKLVVPVTGTYGLATRSDDGSYVFVDGQLVVDNGGVHAATWAEGRVYLEQGVHDLEVRYFQAGGASDMALFWQPPGRGWEPVPPDVLLPYVDELPPGVAVPSGLPSGGAGGAGSGAGVLPRLSPRPVWRVEGCGEGPGALREPRGLAVGPGGLIYVADAGNRRVAVFSREGAFVGAWPGTRGEALLEPFDVAVAPDGTLFVLDAGRQTVLHFALDGTFLGEVALASPLYRPRGLAVAPDGTLLIADTGGARVVRVARDGRLLAQIGGRDAEIGPGQPTDVAVGPDGTLYIAEAESGTLWHVKPDGTVLQRRSIPPSNTVDSPHLAVGPEGRLFVTSSTAQSVLVYDASGQPLGGWGGPEVFLAPVGVAVDPEGRVYVTDSATCAVAAFSLP